MSVSTLKELLEHVWCDVEVVCKEGSKENPSAVSIECISCNENLLELKEDEHGNLIISNQDEEAEAIDCSIPKLEMFGTDPL